MNLTCESCGGKNSLPKGKTEMYCSFCGNHIEIVAKPVEAPQTPVINTGSDKEQILAYLRGGSKGILNLPMADLMGIQLKDANLKGANLGGANLKKADLSGANLSGANLSKANLNKADLSNANLSGSNLSNADLSEAKLFDADLKGTDISNANLHFSSLGAIDFRCWSANMVKSCKLDSIWAGHCNMSGMNLSGINLSSAYLYHANLNGINLSNSNLEWAKLYDVDLCNANLHNANLQYASLRGANLSNANLSGANLQSIYLDEKTNFYNTDLSGADFTDAYLDKVNFKDAKNLKEAKLKGARGLKKGCYLSTACTEAMQLPDYCYELQTLRKFRDEYVAQTPEGRKMIEEYYDTAPEIVDAINATGNGNEIFKGLYSEIAEIVRLIEGGKSEEAVLAYRNLTLSLKNKYLN